MQMRPGMFMDWMPLRAQNYGATEQMEKYFLLPRLEI